MPKIEELDQEGMSKEEKDAKKQEAIDLITGRIDRGDDFLIITENKGDTALMIGGSTEELSRIIALTMTRVPHLTEIVSTAMEAYEYAQEKTGSAKSLKELLDDFAKDHDCTGCPSKDICPIKDDIELLKNGTDHPMEILDMIMKRIRKTGAKPKGEC
jgi:hypothetical protein